MNNNRMKFGYEDTDKNIEIELYGIVFEVDLDSKKINELANIKDNVSLEEMKEYINSILGENAVELINSKRIKDGYKEINENIAIQILMCIFQAYGDSYIGNITNYVDNSNAKLERKYNELNRNVRKYRKRNNRRY